MLATLACYSPADGIAFTRFERPVYSPSPSLHSIEEEHNASPGEVALWQALTTSATPDDFRRSLEDLTWQEVALPVLQSTKNKELVERVLDHIAVTYHPMSWLAWDEQLRCLRFNPPPYDTNASVSVPAATFLMFCGYWKHNSLVPIDWTQITLPFMVSPQIISKAPNRLPLLHALVVTRNKAIYHRLLSCGIQLHGRSISFGGKYINARYLAHQFDTTFFRRFDF